MKHFNLTILALLICLSSFAQVGTISGPINICIGSTGTETDTTAGGTWTSSNPAIGTVASTGIVSGISAGVVTITYTVGSAYSIQNVTIDALPPGITGPTSICVSSPVTETIGTTGGTWSSSNPLIATINPTSGVVTGVSAGVVNLTYTLPSTCMTAISITVNPLPAPITGPSTVCPGTTSTEAASPGGGTWSSSATAVGSVDPVTGIVTGISVGTTILSYTLGTGCTATKPMTVTVAPAPITGASTICAGSSTTLGDASIGGTFISGATSIATVATTTGVATGVSAGVATITYTIGTGCFVTKSITVTASPALFVVTGGGTFCTGGTGVYVGLSGSTSGVSYQLLLGGVPIGAPIMGTGSPFNFGLMTTPGMYTATATGGTGCTATMVSSATVSTNPLPTVFSVTGGGSYCAGGTGVVVGLSGSQTGVNYQLYNGLVPIGAPVPGTGIALSFGLQTVAGTYMVVANSAVTGCSNTMSGSASVSITGLTLFTVTGGGSYCSGGTGVDITLSGSSTGVNYTLYLGVATIASLAGTGGILDFGYLTSIGSYTVIGTNVTTLCAATMTGSATISINPLPVPYSVTGGGSYCTGGTGVNVGLSNSSPGVTYQLYNGAVIVGTAIAGTGGAINFGLQTIVGTYTVIATNPTTACSATMTGSAVVSISTSPTAFTVTGGGAYCSGGTGVNVGLSGSVTGTSYQLYNGGSPVGSTVTGTGSSFNFGFMTTPGVYTVSATSGIGCTGTMTGSVSVSISPLPTVFTVVGGGSYCSGGAGSNILLSGSQTGVNYQLFSAASPVGAPVAGTGSGISFGLQTAAGTYTVVATDVTTSCTNNMSGTAVISVNPVPTTYTVTGGGSYCAGGSGVNVSLSGSQTGVNYQLYRGGAAVGSSISGTGSALSFGLQTLAGIYTVTATNASTGCLSTMSGSATVVIAALPAVYTIAGGGTYCSGGTGVAITLSGSVIGISYQLYLGGVAVGTPVAGTGSTLSFGLFTGSGSYTIVGTDGSTTCTSSMAGSVMIAVSPLPTAYSITGGGTYCIGGSGVAIGLSGSQSGTNYQLYIGSAPVGATVAGTGSTISFGLHSAAGTYTVVATNPTTSCTNIMTGSVTVTISSLPSVYSVTGGGSYCSGGAGVVVGLSNSDAGVSYQLYMGTGVVGAAVAGTGGSISFGLQTAAGTYTVVATNTSTTCSNNMSGSANVIINPTTGPPTVSITASPGLSVCAGTTVTISATPVVGGSTPGYAWTLNGIAISGTTSASYSYVPLAGDIVGVTMTSSSTCVVPATASASVAMTVTSPVTPTIVITASPGTTVCAGTSTTFTTSETGGGSTPSYSWTVNGTTIAGATSSTYSYVPLTGDVVAVLMTSSSTCILSPTVTTSVTMTIDVPAITAAVTSAGCGPTMTLTAGGGTGYSWSPSTGLSCTTCSSASLIPAATTQYTVTGTDGLGCTGTDTVTVDGNRISGYITYTGSSTDTFTVWLIQFNPIDSSILATDSTTNCMVTGTPYYQFMDEPSGNYLVKAKLNSSVPGTSGYIPTYSLSTPYWYLAATVAHSGSYDTMHINMLYGTVPPGPGFIAGYVVSGAGRNTSSDAPAKGMIIYLTDTTGNLLSFTYTDSTGNYSFTNLTDGSYKIYPANYKYYTTPSSVIRLAPGADSATSIDFKQHITSGTITPYDNTKTPVVLAQAKGIAVYPNPAAGVLNIRTDKASAGNADIILTDVTGRDVLRTTTELNATTGNTLNLNGIKDGIYLITIKSDKVFYSSKLVIEQ